MVNNESPDESLPEDPEDDGLGSIDFGFVVGDSPEERLNLKDPGITFENGQPDLDTGRRAFGTGITALHEALAGYSRCSPNAKGNWPSCSRMPTRTRWCLPPPTACTKRFSGSRPGTWPTPGTPSWRIR